MVPERDRRAAVRAFVRMADPLERPTTIQRGHHVRWAISLARQATESCVQALDHADAVRQGA